MATSETEFRELVRRMRKAQTDYFRTRDRGILDASKALERKVDAELEDQGELFAQDRPITRKRCIAKTGCGALARPHYLTCEFHAVLEQAGG